MAYTHKVVAGRSPKDSLTFHVAGNVPNQTTNFFPKKVSPQRPINPNETTSQNVFFLLLLMAIHAASETFGE